MQRSLNEIHGIDPEALYAAPEVALLVFNTKVRTFYRRRKQREQEGFPPPISRWGRKMWSGQVLIDWINRGQVKGVGANVIPISDKLARRAEAMATARQGKPVPA